MERLTQWIDENTAIPRVDLRRCGHERCTTQLARYEDTGLTPDEVKELAERDTAEYVAEKYGIRGDADGQESDLRVRGCEGTGEGDGGRHTE